MPLVLQAATSGQATLTPTDAQTVTLTLPATTGTLAVSGGSPSFATLTVTGDASINSITVGRAGGNLASNTIFGNSSFGSNTGGQQNSAFGYQALLSVTNADSNTAVGSQAMRSNTTGSNHTSVGNQALYSNLTGNNNTALGYRSLYNYTASGSTAIGYNSGYSMTSGFISAAVGHSSLYSNTTGASCVAVGYNSLYANTTGGNNVAVGEQALQSNTTASQNVSVGNSSGLANTTGQYNSFFGTDAGRSNTTGSYNTYMGGKAATGYGCAELMTTGSKNTIIGGFNGNQNSLDIRTSSNYIVLSDGDGNPRVISNGSGEISMNTTPATGYTLTLKGAAGGAQGILYGVNAGSTFTIRIQGDGSIYNYYGTYGTISDARLKENIVDATPKLADLMQVKVRNYNLIDDEFKTKQIGVIAQELETVFPNMVTEDEDGNKAVKSAVFVPMLIKSIQELKATVDAQAARIASLEGSR